MLANIITNQPKPPKFITQLDIWVPVGCSPHIPGPHRTIIAPITTPNRTSHTPLPAPMMLKSDGWLTWLNVADIWWVGPTWLMLGPHPSATHHNTHNHTNSHPHHATTHLNIPAQSNTYQHTQTVPKHTQSHSSTHKHIPTRSNTYEYVLNAY